MKHLSVEWLSGIGDPGRWVQASPDLCGPTSVLARAARLLGSPAELRNRMLEVWSAETTDRLPRFVREFYRQIVVASQASEADLARLFSGLESRQRARATEDARQVLTALCQDLQQLIDLPVGEWERANGSELTAPEARCSATNLLLIYRQRSQIPGAARVRGAVARLVIGYAKGSSGISPRLGSIGLTALSVEEDRQISALDDTGSFSDGVARAYRLFAPKGEPIPLRWWLEPVADESLPHFERLGGRSCEAAFACAIRAALSRIPGSPSPPKDELVDKLDETGAITAKLEAGSDDSGHVRLAPVQGFCEKVLEADSKRLRFVIAAKGQLDQVSTGFERSDRARLGGDLLRRIEVIELETADQAYEHLAISNRVRRAHRLHCQQLWQDQFHSPDGPAN